MLKPQSGQLQTDLLSATSAPKTETSSPTQQMDKLKLDRLLRAPRSKEYIKAIARLDAGGHTHDHAAADAIIDAIRAEFPEVDMPAIMLGIVAKCYLGAPYEVHSLDITGRIIEHYEAGRPMPMGLDRARGIAMHGGYLFIEVYTDCCRAVSDDGRVSVIQG